MGNLNVGFYVVSVTKKVKLFNLFELGGAGCSPETDEILQGYGQLEKVQAYYRAIGRIFALCVLYDDKKGTPISIPYNAMPRLFRNCKSRQAWLSNFQT
jgi:hypothetical protein